MRNSKGAALLLAFLLGLCVCPRCPAQDAAGLNATTNVVGMKLVRISAGSFQMGSGKDFNDAPAHKVTISRPFYLGVCEVTQDQFKRVMGYNPSWLSYKAGECPVDCVSWFEAVEFCKKLSAKEKKTYRLPTEAEWEYAARAGTTTTYYFGEDKAKLGEYAWTADNCQKPMPVGHKKPNAWGLYDMLGNVYEWTADWYANDYYKTSPAADPTGPAKSFNQLGTGGKVARGGNCLGFSGINCLRTERCSSAARNLWTPYAKMRGVGFRVVCEIPQ
jgi:formylglycine-generating enzyme required for sulfatase activity